MPKKFPKGTESRLSREGLRGAKIGKRKVESIWAHGEKRRQRTVVYKDGSAENAGIYELVGLLIEARKR